MAFMEPEIFKGQYYAVEANHGETHYVPADVCGNIATYADLADYVAGTIDTPDDTAIVLSGWLARLSAPGYMDCTDWSVHETRKDAETYLADTYGDDDDDDDDDENDDV